MAAGDREAAAGTRSLFGESEPCATGVEAVRADAATVELADGLPEACRLGTSSWHFPGWAGLVWDRLYGEKQLSREGLAAYARHPLFRTVSLDRTFYKPLSAREYAAYAAAVDDDFRFVIKAPALVTDRLARGSAGRPRGDNPQFLDADTAVACGARPAVAGLGDKLGAIVFQISPLPAAEAREPAIWHDALEAMLAAVHRVVATTSAVLAVEVRDPGWLTPAFAALLARSGATYALGLHPRLPPSDTQLPVLRALWPGPLVCRWNLHARHGAQGYARAKADYAPFDRLVDPDPATRETLAKVAAATANAGEAVFITINNKAEGSAPLSVAALAESILGRDA